MSSATIPSATGASCGPKSNARTASPASRTERAVSSAMPIPFTRTARASGLSRLPPQDGHVRSSTAPSPSQAGQAP